MPKIIIVLGVILMTTALIDAGQSVISDVLYYKKIQHGYVTRKQRRVWKILTIAGIVGWIMSGIGCVAASMYVLLLVHPIPV